MVAGPCHRRAPRSPGEGATRKFGIRRCHAPRGRQPIPLDQRRPRQVCPATFMSLQQAEQHVLSTTRSDCSWIIYTWTRLELHLPSLGSLISIITGHETKLVALARLNGVSNLVRLRRRLARREGRRRAPGLERVIDADLRQSMPHVNGSVWCRARAQQPECRASSTNDSGVLLEVLSHGCARS